MAKKQSKKVTTNNSTNLQHGDRSNRFKDYLDSIGINKEDMMSELEAIPVLFREKVQARIIALETYKTLSQAAIEWYKANDSRALTFAHQLQQLETDIAMHRTRMESIGDAYNPLEDKALQQAEKRKTELISLISKEKIDLGKLAVDVKRNGGAVIAEDIAWDVSDNDE